MNIVRSVGILLGAQLIVSAQTIPAPATKLCGPMTTIAVPQAAYAGAEMRLQRLEIRRCLPEIADGIQLVAWENMHDSPTLVLATSGGDVVQIVASGKIVAIEISGGSKDHVYVIVFENGKPRVALQQTTRERAIFHTTQSGMKVEVPNHWTNRTDYYSFPEK